MKISNVYQELDFHSTNSLKQQSGGRHVTPLGIHYSNSKPTSLCSYNNAACLAEKQQISILVFGLT